MKFLLLTVCLFCSCGLTFDVDSVPLNRLDNSNGLPDIGADLPDLPRGEVCPQSTAGTFDDSACDPVRASGCVSGQFCGLALKNGNELAAACRGENVATDGPGESCSATSCVAGYHCVNRDGAFSCERLCWRADALGCTSGEVCTPFEGAKIGWCAPACL